MPNFFFFQAEDGIRDTSVTGVQTCALPIYLHKRPRLAVLTGVSSFWRPDPVEIRDRRQVRSRSGTSQIGRASCRERVEIAVVARGFERKRERRLWTLGM